MRHPEKNLKKYPEIFGIIKNKFIFAVQITIKPNTMKKITRSTIKSFIKKNQSNLYIRIKSQFSGYTDCIESVKSDFVMTEFDASYGDYRLGVAGAWFVGGSRDYFTAWENEDFSGYEVYNCCGTFILAVRK